jgi:hypothetical protein
MGRQEHFIAISLNKGASGGARGIKRILARPGMGGMIENMASRWAPSASGQDFAISHINQA